MQPADILIVLTTCPDEKSAKKIAFQLVEKQIAACVNLIPNVVSIYSWQNQINQDDELLLIIKTNPEKYKSVEKSIISCHPYELPEILAVPIKDGFTGYISWIQNYLSAETEKS